MEIIRDWWAAFTAGITAVVWLVRLEASNKMALREIARLEREMESDRKRTMVSRQETNDMLREMRGDIKRLLERSSH